MVELTGKLIYFMNTLGVTAVRNHTRKHTRRRIEGEFGESLHMFDGDNGRLLVVSDKLTVEMVATEYMKVKIELDTISQIHTDSSSHKTKNVAVHLR
ncbi:hypothetical protein LSAT2_019238 [Lamellibrachia satsuma]|nr:hypothetical protein LSAT2_019238 [Lamellibrachia satsuma]